MTQPPMTYEHLTGHIKVRLSYKTHVAVTGAAVTMQDSLGVPGPYTEEVWVLLPTSKVRTTLEAFQEPFQALKDARVVPDDAQLVGFGITSPLLDLSVKAYVLPGA